MSDVKVPEDVRTRMRERAHEHAATFARYSPMSEHLMALLRIGIEEAFVDAWIEGFEAPHRSTSADQPTIFYGPKRSFVSDLAQVPCDLPPADWSCSRPCGHEGPCAATPKKP